MMMTGSLKKISTILASKKKGEVSVWHETSKGWTYILDQVMHMLDSIISDSEGEFLVIGDRLQEFYSSAQLMCTQSTSVGEIMTGEGLDKATEGLTNILDELKAHLEDSESHFIKITGIFEEHLSALGKVSSHLEDLDMLVLNLSMLGFFTRVESAHIISIDSGFGSLTDDVRMLAENIKEKSLQIRTVSESVKTFITHALSKIAEFEKSQSESARTAHKHAVANHFALSKKNKGALESARLIEQKSKEIASSIGNIIMSIQFHDITRQQIEHVKEVFDLLRTRIKGNNNNDDMQHAALMRDILKLQRAQLKQSEDDLVSAVMKIIENLLSISKSVGEILSETNDVAWASETEESSFMEDLDLGISSVIDCIKVTADEQAKLTETVSSASEMVSEMSVFVQDIETLGLNLQLIALNARIKAAHLGQEGAALDTISGSIYELSRNARQDTVTLTMILASLVQLSMSFKQDLIVIQDKQVQTVSLMVEKLKELIASLHNINDKVLSMLTDMTKLGESLRNDIRKTADGIVVHENVKNMLNDIITVVDKTSEGASLICPSGENIAVISFLADKDIEKLYTMKSERNIHLQHIDSLQTGHKPDIKNDDLVDNVEFF
jgi:hypothetical protein